MLPRVREGCDRLSALRRAEAAARAAANAAAEIRIWDIDPTGTCTPSLRAAGGRALGYLGEAIRAAQAAYDEVYEQALTADAQRGVRVEADAQGVLDTSG